MSATTSNLVQRLWGLCNILRDDGTTYQDYVTELTYLLFLKMLAETGREGLIPPDCRWSELTAREGDALLTHYRATLLKLGTSGHPGIRTIFDNAQTSLRKPANLRELVGALDRLDWYSAKEEGLGDLYEGLLEKNAAEKKSGAGQYFTPRALIDCMVRLLKPQPGEVIQDPAAGTGGFLVAADRYIKARTDDLFTLPTAQQEFQRREAFRGLELVPGTHRLLTMNLLLHGIGTPDGESLIEVKDALLADPGRRYSVVLSNPPFGRKSSITMVGADGREVRDDREISRPDFITTTANKQLNFLQHIVTVLDINGRAAVVLPDNVLFEGGAGETIRRHLLKTCDVHTLLRLPTGIFYAQGVKANVLFFDKKPAAERPWTQRLWVYDLRTNQHFTLKQNPLRREHLQDFVDCFAPGKPRPARVETERFRSFTYDELIARDKTNLDITWLRDDSLDDLDNLPEPAVIASEIVEDLTAALAEFEAVAAALEEGRA